MAHLTRTAETDPEAALALVGNSSEVSRLFGDEDRLPLSLGQRWITMLVAKLDQAAYEGTGVEQVKADLEATEPGLPALVKIGTRRSLRVRSLTRGGHVAVDLLRGPRRDRQTVA